MLPGRRPAVYELQSNGRGGAIGCGLVLVCLGVFLLTPLALLFIKAVAWVLIGIGAVGLGLGLWSWLRSRR